MTNPEISNNNPETTQRPTEENLEAKIEGYAQTEKIDPHKYEEIIYELQDLSEGKGDNNIHNQHYKGWSNEDFKEVLKRLGKELIKFDSPEIKRKELKKLITKIGEVNKHWDNIDNSSGIIGVTAKSNEMDEGDVRDLEKQIVSELVYIDFNKEDLSENDLTVINKYLSTGDIGYLKHKIANKSGIKYRDPFENEPTHGSTAAKQILKEIDKREKLN
jgi:hypothetical protein